MTKTANKDIELDERVAQALLDAAARELAEHGYDGASLDRILVAAGLRKDAFHAYFDDKADLAAAVLEREIRRYDLRDLKRVTMAADFWTELERYAWKSVEELRAAPERRDLLIRLGAAIARAPALRDRLAPLIAEWQQHLIEVWQRGQALGAVRTDIPASTLMTVAQAVKLALGEAMLPADRGVTDDDLETFTRVYLDLLRRIAEPRHEQTRP